MLAYVNFLLVFLNIVQTTPKCRCYQGENSTGDIYTMYFRDTSYVLKVLDNFHGQFTSFEYAGNYLETDSTILVDDKSFYGNGTARIKKNEHAIFLERELMLETYIIKMKKTNCAKLKINKIPKDRITPFPDKR